MDHGERVGATTVWEFDAAQVSRMWVDTREVFGNKLWVEGMYDLLLGERQGMPAAREVCGLVIAAVGNLDPRDPSEVFLAFRREFAKHGIAVVFAPHPDHGDLVERARKVEAGEPLPAPDPCHLDEDLVVEIWDLLEDGFVDCGDEVAGWLPEDLLDQLELATGERAFLTVGWALRGMAEDDDRSLAFVLLRELAAEHGVELTFAPHPHVGDLLERAERLRSGRPA